MKRWEPIEHLIAQTGYPLDHYNRLTGANVQWKMRPLTSTAALADVTSGKNTTGTTDRQWFSCFVHPRL